MTAWESRKYVLACDHFDEHRATPDKPEGIRCSSRFDIGFGHSRARVRQVAVRKGWVHLHEPGAPRTRDKDYCPLHISDVPVVLGNTGELADFDPSTGRSSQDDWK